MECSSSAVEDLTDLRSWVFWFLVNFLTESLVWALWIVLRLSCKSLFFYKSWYCLGVQCLTQPSPCHPPVLWHLQQCGNVCTEAAEAVWGTLGLAWPMIHVLPAVQLFNVPWGCQAIFLRYKSLKILTERISALDRGCDRVTLASTIIRANVRGCLPLLGSPAHRAHFGIKSVWGLTCRDLSVFAGWIFTELMHFFHFLHNFCYLHLH